MRNFAGSLSRRRHRFLAAAVILIMTVALLAAPPTAQQAQAQTQTGGATSDGVNFGDCDFRIGTGAAEQWANQICWLDMRGFDQNGKITKRIGQYTLTADVTVEKNRWADNARRTATFTPQSEQAWSEAAFGKKGFFEKDPASNQLDILKMRYGWARIKLNNIKIVDAAGNPVPNSRLMLADAEATGSGGPGEWISASASNGVTKLDAIKSPFSNNGTCQGRFGPGNEPEHRNWTGHEPIQRDFVCWDNNGSGNRGMFVAAMDDPTWAEISIGVYDSGFQAIALGVALGRVQFANDAGRVNVKSNFEELAAGKASTADYTAVLREGTNETPIDIPAEGGYTTFIRKLGAGGVPTDQLVYRSKMTTDGANPFDRYEPEWTCVAKTDGAPVVTRLRSGSKDGLAVTNNRETGTTEIATTNQDNREINCTVSWESKYQPATLELSKHLEGTAKDFSEMNDRKFIINYKCDDLNGFEKAYPGRLSGSRTFTRGQSETVTGLPVGANCTVWESFQKGDKPVLPGKTLKLGWGSNGASTATNYKQGQNGAKSDPALNLKLGATNNAAAHNIYDFKPGTLHLSKEILGEPVTEAVGGGAGSVPTPTYKFRIKCDTTQFDVEKQLTLARRTDASGKTVVDGTIDITGIPTERPCSVTPLTDLNTEQQNYIHFDSRVVTVGNASTNPVEPSGPQGKSYEFRLPENAPETTIDFKTTYSYVKRDLTVHKLLAGEGGASQEFDGKDFTVNYRCERKGEYDRDKQLYIPNIAPVEGSVTVGRGKDAVIPDLKVGAECKVWEDESKLPQTSHIEFEKAVVASNNAQDQTTELTNADAATKPVLTVRPTGDTEQNLVTVTNTYKAKLGTVDVKKAINNTAPGFTPPSSYEVKVRCGKRNLFEDGAARPYDLVGTVNVAANGTSTVVADDPKLNVNGAMAVPYGNECTFEETPPTYPAGVEWTLSGTESETIEAPSTTKTITNTFAPRGSGLTISQVLQGEEALVPEGGVAYRLTCTGGSLAAPMTQEFTLTRDNPRKKFDANFAPSKSNCVLERTSPETNERTVNGTTFPVTNTEGYRFAVDNDPVRELGQSERFTVGNTSAVIVTQNYGLLDAPVTAHKHITFKEAYPGGPTYISDPRKSVKLHREFPVTLTCTDPLSRETLRLETTVSVNKDPQSGVNVYDGAADINANVPVGSTCEVEEKYTTTATGISLERDIAVNGNAVPGARGDADNTGAVGGSFAVGRDKNDLVFNNSYTRRTTEMTVKKIADLPGSIREKVSAEELQSKLHDHTITMVCRDPEARDSEGNEVPLFEAPNGSIHGEGEHTFTNVPVGSDCEFTGDNFGSLKLEANGLSAYLRPQHVSWSALGSGGDVTADSELKNEVASSPLFTSVDDAKRNVVGLENHYRYEMAPVTLTKDVVGEQADIETLTKDQTKFNFAMSCRALGYESSTIGGQRNSIGYGYNNDSGEPYVLPRTVVWGTGEGRFTRQEDQNGMQVWRFTSDEAYVPAGSDCSFTELSPEGVDPVLSFEPREKDVQKAVAAPAAPPEQPAATDLAFTNDVDRRTATVRFVAYESGYVEGEASPYTAEVKCTFGTETKAHRTYTVNIERGAVSVGSLPTSDLAPAGGVELELPAGGDCSIDYGDSPSLQARPVIDVTGIGDSKNRRPYTQFATWTDGTREGPTTSLAATDLETIGEKNYAHSFTVPQSSDAQTGIRQVIGVEAFHPRARVDVEVNKTAAGGDSANATFKFNQSCTSSNQDFTLKNGGKHIIENVYVGNSCLITESNDGDGEISSILDVTGQGSRISDLAVSEGSASAGEESAIVHQDVRFTALPVADASDFRIRDSRLWRLDLRNRFPSLKVTKSIDGTPLGDATGALTGVTLLPSDAKSMRVTYTAKNDGAFPLSGMTLNDASLAGRTLTPVKDGAQAGDPVTVGEDGTIPAGVCTPPATLPAGEEYACTFDVDISDKSYEEDYRYPDDGGEAPVTVTATMEGANGQKVTATDSQGALRPSGLLGFLLPETGMQTLVWFLILGLILFGIGAWRVLRRDDDDDEDIHNGNGPSDGGPARGEEATVPAP
ncbi:CshA/CshB family fibrillar adhesin-related protein [Corynebacterium sp. 20_84]